MHLKKKRFPNYENLLKHQEQEQKSSAAWKHRWQACVLIALQGVRTLSLGSRPCEYPHPRTGP